MFLRAADRATIAGIISIHGPREFGVDGNVPNRLDLTFDDVDVPAPNDMLGFQRAAARKRWSEQNNLTEIPPTPTDAEAIIRFARAVVTAQSQRVPPTSGSSAPGLRRTRG